MNLVGGDKVGDKGIVWVRGVTDDVEDGPTGEAGGATLLPYLSAANVQDELAELRDLRQDLEELLEASGVAAVLKGSFDRLTM